MKKMFIFCLLCLHFSSFGQVTKQDMADLLSQFKFGEMQRVNIYNIRLFFEDGTNRQTYESYPISKLDYELRENSFFLKHYTDETRKTLKGIYLVPYNKIRTIYIAKESLEISLND